uniref:Serpin domain-containing protein n=1 Tax=Oryza glumipatula TaxID=40148 RepID=A0A0E0ANI6_9ORYZ
MTGEKAGSNASARVELGIHHSGGNASRHGSSDVVDLAPTTSGKGDRWIWPSVKHARNQINEWTRQVTRGLIDSLLPPGSVGPTTVIVLGNTIYLKGSWEHPFMVKNTKRKPFYCLDAGVVVHDMSYMSSSNSKQYIVVHGGFKVFKLHYSVPKLRNKHKRGRGDSNDDDLTHNP